MSFFFYVFYIKKNTIIIILNQAWAYNYSPPRKDFWENESRL